MHAPESASKSAHQILENTENDTHPHSAYMLQHDARGHGVRVRGRGARVRVRRVHARGHRVQIVDPIPPTAVDSVAVTTDMRHPRAAMDTGERLSGGTRPSRPLSLP